MEKYISKDALVAEIERRINEEIQSCATDNCFGYSQGCVDSMRNVLSFLNTLEVKEVDLEKELKTLDNTLFDLDGVAVQGATHYLTVEDVKDIAKHFFELGLHYSSNSINFGNVDDILKEDGIDPDSKEGIKFKEYYYMALDAALKYFKPQKGE